MIPWTQPIGDNWEHRIRIEDIVDPGMLNPLPELLKGRGACPPENCGGIHGYQALLAGDHHFTDGWTPRQLKELQEAKFDPNQVEFTPAKRAYELWLAMRNVR